MATGKPLKVQVSCIANDFVRLEFTSSLLGMVLHSFRALPGAQIQVTTQSCTVIHVGREHERRAAIDTGADWWLSVDSDTAFPPDALARLIARNVPVVGVNYATRDPVHPMFTAMRRVSTGEFDPGERVVTSSTSTGLAEVEAVGWGVTLLRRDALMAVGEPLFEPRWLPNARKWLSEDFAACEKLRAAGFKILVDQDLSREVVHFGRFPFGAEHAYMASLGAYTE